MNNPQTRDSIVIDRLGGTVAVANLCKISPQAVSQWRESGIPSARVMFLQLLRPDAFVEKSNEVA
jgi:hypothetical protein